MIVPLTQYLAILTVHLCVNDFGFLCQEFCVNVHLYGYTEGLRLMNGREQENTAVILQRENVS